MKTYGAYHYEVRVKAIHRIDKHGEIEDNQDCVAGIEVSGRGVLRLDLRNLRPIRVLDRDCLIIEIYLADILTALADKVEEAVKE